MQKGWVHRMGAAAAAVPLAMCLSSCADDDEEDVSPTDATFVAPVTAFDAALDTALWDDGTYETAFLSTIARGGQKEVDADESGGTSGRGTTDSVEFARPLGALFATWGVVVGPECAPTVPVVDNDEDGIPASYTATFTCTDQKFSDRSTSVTGQVTVTDADDGSPTGGLSVVFDNFLIAVSRTDGMVRIRTLNGTLTFGPAGERRFQAARRMTVAFDFVDPDNKRVQGTFAGAEETTYVPDLNIAQPFDSGAVGLAGGGTLSRTFNGGMESRQVSRTASPPLHWNRKCRAEDPTSSGFDWGILSYQEQSGEVLELDYTGCEDPSVRRHR